MAQGARVLQSARRHLNDVGPIVSLLTFCTWVIVAFRALPVPRGDFGLYVSVSERLLAGDHLYREVFENKDPLLHYTLAVFRLPSPFGAWALQLLLLVAVGVSTVYLSRSVGLSKRQAVFLGMVAAPLIVTGSTYLAGSSELPGVALVMVIAAVLLRCRWALGGVLVGILAFYKLIMLPIALVLIVVVAAVGRDWQRARRAFVAAILTAVAIVAVLAMRGELTPYVSTLRDNVAYSSDVQDVSGAVGLVTHLTNVINVQVLIMLATSLVLTAAAWLRQRELFTSCSAPLKSLAWASVGTLVAALVVVSLTGLWRHHAMIFVPSVLMSLLVFTEVFVGNQIGVRPRTLIVGLAVVWLLAAAPIPATYLNPVEYARANLNLQTQLPRAAEMIRASGPPTTYARVGQGDDDGHALGLRDWRLECRRFFQAFYESERILDETLSCLPNAEVILVDRDARPVSEARAWNDYLASVEELLESRYECREGDRLRVCVRRSDLGTQ